MADEEVYLMEPVSGAASPATPHARPFPPIGDVALSLLWASMACAKVAAVVDAARAGDVVAGAHHLVVCAILAINAALFLLRGRASARASGLWPKIVALVGTWAVLPLAALPLTQRNGWLLATTTVALTLAYLFAGWGFLTLRRSFSVLPEARQFVRHGPYAFVRHPLYATYMAIYVLVALPRFGLPAVILAALGITAEALRARNEERVLQAAFPEYAAYARVTPRFYPRLFPIRVLRRSTALQNAS